MRLNKYIADAGIASRRKADELIANGNVKINGLTVREMGYRVVEGDVVEVNGNIIKAEKENVYFLFNKPIGCVTTVSDDKGRVTVMDFMNDVEERIFPVGRLDYNTSGMLIMTNDGELAYRVTHPKHELTKTYRARVKGVLTYAKLAKLRKGIDIGGYVTRPAKVEVINQGDRSAVVEITIHEGKNRQVRKMFAAIGHNVQELERIAIGNIKLGHTKQGHFRKLTKEEIEYLKKC